MLESLKSELAAKGKVHFYVKVRTRAPKSKLLEVLDDGCIKIAIGAVPVQGKANLELIRFLAGEFKVPKYKVTIKAGTMATPHKLIAIVQ